MKKQIDREGEKMARYRMYKNGIFGHRYQKYYIVKNDDKHFTILNDKGGVYKTNMTSFTECEWEIDKVTASAEDKAIMNELYQKEVYQLSAIIVDLMQKKEEGPLNKKDASVFRWTEKIRSRKVNNLSY